MTWSSCPPLPIPTHRPSAPHQNGRLHCAKDTTLSLTVPLAAACACKHYCSFRAWCQRCLAGIHGIPPSPARQPQRLTTSVCLTTVCLGRARVTKVPSLHTPASCLHCTVLATPAESLVPKKNKREGERELERGKREEERETGRGEKNVVVF